VAALIPIKAPRQLTPPLDPDQGALLPLPVRLWCATSEAVVTAAPLCRASCRMFQHRPILPPGRPLSTACRTGLPDAATAPD